MNALWNVGLASNGSGFFDGRKINGDQILLMDVAKAKTIE
jgi:hypothetical protein